MPADFRVEGVRRVALLAAPSDGERVAVAPGGALLRGELDALGGECWLRIELSEDHPLRVPGELETCWVHAGEDCRPPPLVWAGAKHARTVGPMLDLQWERPFRRSGNVEYSVRMQPEGGKGWDAVWHGLIGEDFGSHRVEVTLEWPYPVAGAKLVVDAVLDQIRLTSAPADVHCRPEHLPAVQARPATAVRTTTAGGLLPQAAIAGIETRAEMLGRASKKQSADSRPVAGAAAAGPRHVALRRWPAPPSPRLPAAGAAAAAAPPTPFRRALVMGLYHSCTTAMASELERCLGIPVANKLITNQREVLWKHRVHRSACDAMGEDTLIVLMVKEPCFWLQSVARNFYDLHPVAEDEQGCLQDVTSRTLGSLFGCVEHDQVIYPNAVSLWSDAVCSYFDDAVYPASSSVVVRAEDFLFQFDAVMDELAATWSSGVHGAGATQGIEPRQRAMKSGARSRGEALAYYSDPANRARGFTEEQLERVFEGMDPQIQELLGYGDDAVTAWTSQGQ